MARVSKETVEKLNAFLDSLPADARSKCALCNETLTHIVKSAEAQTGAGTATVTRVLSEKINEGATPRDQVSPESLRQKVIGATTDKNLSVRNEQITHDSEKWPVCKHCGENKVNFKMKKRRGTNDYCEVAEKDGLCGRCRVAAQNKKKADAKREFETVPVSQKSEAQWKGFAEFIDNHFSGEIHFEKISRETLEAVIDARNTLDQYIELLLKNSTFDNGT